MAHIFVTRRIPEEGIAMLKEKGHELVISEKDGVLTKEELLQELRAQLYDGVLCLLTDKIDAEVLDAAPSAKIFANYAVGFDNVDLAAAKERGVTVTNTPGVLTDTVAEHTVALMLAITSRIAEGDRFIRAGKYDGWAPMMLLGTDLKGKTLGLLGAGRIGGRVGEICARGMGMKVIYYDLKQSPEFEGQTGAEYRSDVESVLREADVVSVHVPLLDSTRHLINAERLRMMKPGVYLVNSSRGPVIDEAALVDALKANVIRGAALDVFENEPELAEGLSSCENVVLTPHIASATDETRAKMSEIAASNLIAFFEGAVPPNAVAN